jgi:YgiT-type zinc finger domain-containing protein
LGRLQEAKGKVRLGVCPICGGRTDERVVDLLENLDGVMAVMKGIRAEVCVQCGEKLYAEAEMRRIEGARQKIRNKELTPVRLEEVPVFQV